jgi:hypothetical protein
VGSARAPDSSGNQRDVWKFRLAFDQPVPRLRAAHAKSRSVLRRPRTFAPSQPAPRRVTPKFDRATPEEIAALQEKANQEHCRLVARLAEVLAAAGWTNVEEIPAAVDLWVTAPDASGRVIFEVKTLSGTNEVGQCRAALAQLFEYRFFYGEESDRLCVVVNGPVADRRRAFLEGVGVALIVIDGNGTAKPIGQLARDYCSPTLFALP